MYAFALCLDLCKGKEKSLNKLLLQEKDDSTVCLFGVSNVLDTNACRTFKILISKRINK